MSGGGNFSQIADNQGNKNTHITHQPYKANFDV